MARKQFTDNGQLIFVTTLSSTTAPTVAQISAGVNLTSWLKQDGLNRSSEASLVPTEDASNEYDTTDIGTVSATFEAMFYRDSTPSDDDAWTTLPRGTRGWMIVAPFGFNVGTGSATPVVGDKCEVWPVAVAKRSNDQIGKNVANAMSVTFAVTSAPNEDATVA